MFPAGFVVLLGKSVFGLANQRLQPLGHLSVEPDKSS